jgi:hypothetical protein
MARLGQPSAHACMHCSVFWPNFLKCDPLLVLSVLSQGVVFQEIRPKKRAMLACDCVRVVRYCRLRLGCLWGPIANHIARQLSTL